MVLVLVVAAVAVAGATAWKILTLPGTGDIRYAADDPRTRLNNYLEAFGLGHSKEARQRVLDVALEGGGNIDIRLDDPWTAADIGERRARYLAAGGLVAATLLGAAIAVALLGARSPRPLSGVP